MDVNCLGRAKPSARFLPPGPMRPAADAGARFLARVFPGVPTAWVLFRLCAFAAAGVLFALEPLRVRRCVRSVAGTPASPAARAVALAIVAVHAACVPWVPKFGSAGQSLERGTSMHPAFQVGCARARIGRLAGRGRTRRPPASRRRHDSASVPRAP